MELTGYNYIDTSTLLDEKQPKSLKDCVRVLLNAEIQSEGTVHSSIIDARGTLALFHFIMVSPISLIDPQMVPALNSNPNNEPLIGQHYILKYSIEPFTEQDLQISIDHALKKKQKSDRRKKLETAYRNKKNKENQEPTTTQYAIVSEEDTHNGEGQEAIEGDDLIEEIVTERPQKLNKKHLA